MQSASPKCARIRFGRSRRHVSKSANVPDTLTASANVANSKTALRAVVRSTSSRRRAPPCSDVSLKKRTKTSMTCRSPGVRSDDSSRYSDAYEWASRWLADCMVARTTSEVHPVHRGEHFSK